MHLVGQGWAPYLAEWGKVACLPHAFPTPLPQPSSQHLVPQSLTNQVILLRDDAKCAAKYISFHLWTQSWSSDKVQEKLWWIIYQLMWLFP